MRTEKTNSRTSIRLKVFRAANDLSRAELSALAGVSARTIRRIENAETKPSLRTIERLALALDCELVDLLPTTSQPVNDEDPVAAGSPVTTLTDTGGKELEQF